MPTLIDEAQIDHIPSGELAAAGLDEAAVLAGGMAVMVEAIPERPTPVDGVARVAITGAQQSDNDSTKPGEGRDVDALNLYVNKIHEYDLLTKDDEVSLGKQVREGKEARDRLEEPDLVLTEDERNSLYSAIQAGEAAERKFFFAYLRLVVTIARRYRRNRRLKFLDHIQEGNIGLLRAVEKFDERRGFRFATFARAPIRNAIWESVMAHSHRGMRIPSGAGESIIAVSKATRELKVKLGRDPTEEEIAEETRLTPKRLKELAWAEYGNTQSLDESQPGKDRPFQETVADRTVWAPEEKVAESSVIDALYDQLGFLTKQERTIIVLFYELDGGEPMTESEIGKKLGLTESEVYAIKKRAISKLSHPSRPDIRGFDGDRTTEGWRDRANCLGTDTKLFFPEKRGSKANEARKVCRDCKVAVDCLEFALLKNPDGVWGGTLALGRKEIRKQREVAAKTKKPITAAS